MVEMATEGLAVEETEEETEVPTGQKEDSIEKKKGEERSNEKESRTQNESSKKELELVNAPGKCLWCQPPY